MANTSIKNAFERMWQHIVSKFATKDELNAKQDAITGLTNGMVMICNQAGEITTSPLVSTTELGYLNGVTSSIQTQLNNDVHKWQGSYTGDIDSTSLNGLYWLVTGDYTGTVPDDMPQYAFLEATMRHQKLMYFGNSGITKICERYYTNNKWYQWFRTDFIPNKMTIGTEYNTGKLWNGKAVYAKWVNFGALPNNALKAVDVGSLVASIKIVDYNFIIYSATSVEKNVSIAPYDFEFSVDKVYARGYITFDANTGATEIRIGTSRDMTYYSAYVYLEYTKD